MSDPISVPDQFTTAMQQLSAEAEKSKPTGARQEAWVGGSPEASQSLEARLQNLERTVCRKIDELTKTVTESKGHDLTTKFQQLEEHLAAIRNTESVNQRLFDSLHDELLKYRDNFVHESLQKPFIHDLVHLFDDLNSLASQLQANTQEQKKRSHIAQWHENLENAVHALVEILHRFDVDEVEPRDTVDKTLHRVISYEPADYPEEDGQIVMRLKRGFSWRGKLIRPEEVIAKRYG